MQYKIPQNVGIEDRIVGPLTLKQLIILAIGFGLSYSLFVILNRVYELNVLEYTVIAFPGIISAGLALIKINDISLGKYILLFLEFSIKPKRRVWDHRGILNIVDPDLSAHNGKNIISATPTSSEKPEGAKSLSDLTKMLDSGHFDHVPHKSHDDIDAAQDDDLMVAAYFGHKDNNSGNMYWRTKEAHKEMLEIFAKLPVTQLKEGTKETTIAQNEIKKVKEEVENKSEKQSSNKPKANLIKKRKRRTISQPVRQKPINTLRPKKQLRPSPPNSTTGTINLDELDENDTIEINLD